MRTPANSARSVYIVAGAAGTGKSTLGRALAVATGAVVLDQDTATNPLMAQIAALVGAGDDLDHPRLRGPVRQARYQCLIDIAVDNGRLGRDVVMIAPFTAECSDPAAWSELTRQLAPARVDLIWVSVPPEVAVARRVRRNLSRDTNVRLGVVPERPPAPMVPHVAASGSADPHGEARRLAGLIGHQGCAPPTGPQAS